MTTSERYPRYAEPSWATRETTAWKDQGLNMQSNYPNYLTVAEKIEAEICIAHSAPSGGPRRQ